MNFDHALFILQGTLVNVTYALLAGSLAFFISFFLLFSPFKYFKQIRELSATGLFFKRYFDLDENYNGFSLSLLYQINKHFEVGSYYNLTLDSQYKSLSKTWGNTLDGFIHKVYLRNLDLRFYYNF